MLFLNKSKGNALVSHKVSRKRTKAIREGLRILAYHVYPKARFQVIRFVVSEILQRRGKTANVASLVKAGSAMFRR